MTKIEEKTKLEVYDDATGELVVIDDPELEEAIRAGLAEAERTEGISREELFRRLRAQDE